MLDFLKVKYTKPIEREYESWIVQEIEKYFNSLGINFVLFAVSPQDEKDWPADIQISHPGFLVGLQFKRAMIDKSKFATDLNDLYWSLGTPKRQFYNILATKEIYYCLPTFINRSFNHQSLHHCLFWRPNIKTIVQDITRNGLAYIIQNKLAKNTKNPFLYLRAKYGSKNSDKTCFRHIKKAHRWGLFVEEIPEIGKRIYNTNDIKNAFNSWILRESPNYCERYHQFIKEFEIDLWNNLYNLYANEEFEFNRETIKEIVELFKEYLYKEYWGDEETQNENPVSEGRYLLFIEQNNF